ncbi:MAG: BglII/BstYI family type II restriction endonuclease [Candidatus Thorarchaeota archaeon]
MAIFKYKNNKEISDLLEIITVSDFPSEDSRKILGDKRKYSVREVVKQMFNDSLSGTWDCDVAIFDSTQIPASKLHYVKNRIGIIRSMQHRTTLGTDILRLEVAHRVLDIIDVGVFICGTSDFERYYLGTEKQKKERMVIFEELIEYLDMISDIISVPILVIGLNKPPIHQQKTLS